MGFMDLQVFVGFCGASWNSMEFRLSFGNSGRPGLGASAWRGVLSKGSGHHGRNRPSQPLLITHLSERPRRI